MRHPIQWISPSPLWARFAPAGGGASVAAEDQFRPAILRFASDDFMDRLLAVLAKDPKALGELLARPETWRTPMGEAPSLVEQVPLPRLAKTLGRLRAAREPKGAIAATESKVTRREQATEREMVLKLYQPAHQRFYLVAADLVCQTAGFPRHAIGTGGREQVAFVLRRLLPTTTSKGEAVEHAFVKNARGMPEWKAVGTDTVSAGEERLPLFPLNFADDLGHPRRLLAGMIPVGRREEYMHTGPARPSGETGDPGDANTTAVSARKEQLKIDVAEPWKNLIRGAFMTLGSVKDRNAKAPDGYSIRQVRREQARTMNRQLQMQSWLVLLDFADYLAAHLPDVWKAIVDQDDNAFPASTSAGKLYRWLGAATMSAGLRRASGQSKRVAGSLRDALREIAAPGVRKGLEGTQALYAASNENASQWPAFQFLLAGIAEDASSNNNDSPSHFTLDGPYASLGAVDAPAVEDLDKDASPGTVGASASADLVDRMVALVVKAIDPARASEAPPLPFAATLQRALEDLGDDPGWFVIRCIHERCDCGPLHPILASPPSQKFQLAGFFDPDAPARAIRIALPIDTTPAGLRKFNKNAALICSDQLCGQLSRAKAFGFIDLVLSVLPWPFHKDLPTGEGGPCTAGMVCSLSIPIVTLCALILMIIIVSVLDTIFRWLPFLFMCFPVRALRAKKPEAGGAP